MAKLIALNVAAAVWVALLAGMLIAQDTPRATVHGVVLSRETGQPIPGATVSARGLERPWWRDVRADKHGRFELREVTAGLARFTAHGAVHQMTKPLRVDLRESASNTVTLLAEPVAPFLRLRTDRRRQFTPDEPALLKLAGYSKGSRVAIEVRRLSLPDLRDRKERVGYEGDFRVPRTLGTLLPEHGRVLDPAPKDQEGAIRTQLSFRLPPGLYSIWAATPDAADGSVVSISRIGLVTKFDGRTALGYVQDLVDNRPVANAEMECLLSGQSVASGRTDANGLFTTTIASSEGGECRLIARSGDSYALTDTYASTSASAAAESNEGDGAGEMRTYFYTDRPVYRPGQHVFFKGIVRRRVGADYRVPAGVRLHLAIQDAGDSTVLEEELTTNSFGSFHGELALDPEAATGLYTAHIRIGAQEETGSFSVAEYRKPEYEIEVTPAKRQFVRGEPVRFTITARYYWGEPVRGARIRYTAARTPEWYVPDDDESGFLSEFYAASGAEEETTDTGFGEEAVSGEAVTDASGRYVLEFVPQLPESDTQDYRTTVEADVTDAGRLGASGKGSALVTRGTFRIALDVDRSIVRPRESATLKIRAVDYEGHPRAHLPVAVQAGPVELTRVETDNDGRATVTVPTSAPGDLTLTARARDERGNEVAQQTSLWVTDGSFSDESYGYAGLELVADRTSYRAGDTATVLINVNRPGGYALFTVEGDRLFEHRLIPLTSKSNMQQVPIVRGYLPNVYVSVVTVQGRQFNQQQKMLRVSPQEFALNVSVTADRARYHPGDRATFTVRATDNRGRPADAELSLGVVDEAIYAIRPDRTMGGIQYFYRYQQNRVQTTTSFPELYLADDAKDAGVSHVRKDFPDTVKWFPDLRTGAGGMARVTVRLPDSLTTWRATARGHTLATQVGTGITKVICSKDLFIRLETPRFFTQKDHSLVTTIVHNDTPQPQRVRVRVHANGARLTGTAEMTLDVAAQDSVRTDWPVALDTPGTASFTASAVANSGANDAVQKPVPVVPHGAESRAGSSGELRGDSTTLSLDLPPGAIPAATDCQLTVSASPAGVLLQGLDYLHAQEYGTTENAVGWFLPDMTVAMTFHDLGIHSQALEKRLGPSVERSLARLYRLQLPTSDNGGGGWGWSAGAEEDPFWTAYALYGLVQAKRAGFDVDEDAIASGTKALTRLLPKERNPSNRALICYVLVQAGRAPVKELADLEARLPELQGKVKNYAIALLALALERAGERSRAFEVAKRLERTVKLEGSEAHWPEIYDWGFYSCNEYETTGYAMMALIRTDPRNPLIDQAARWLIRQRQGGGWASTEDTASIIYALGAYILRERQLSPPDYTATLRVNGQPAGLVRMTAARMFEAQTLAIPAAMLHTGANQVQIERRGPGRLIYGLSLKTYVEGEDLLAETAGLHVERQYFQRLRVRDLNGRRLEKAVPAGTLFRSGDEILVRLIVEVRDPNHRGECREVVLHDPLPAGCEAVDEPDDEEGGYEVPATGGNWWDAAEQRREVRDKEVIFYASYLRPGKNVFHYRIHAAQPGNYHVLPARAVATYIPEISGRSAEDRVGVRG